MHHLQTLCCLVLLVSILHAGPSRQGTLFQKRSNLRQSFGVPGINNTFDYVIVGGGTAGLTVASRLAEDTSLSIAVIEAGVFYEADDGNTSVVPGYCNFYSGTDPDDTNPLVDWGFNTIPQAVSILLGLTK